MKEFAFILFLLFLNFHSYCQDRNDSVAYSSDTNWNLILAAYNNDSTNIFYWLEEGAAINYETSEGITALMYAVENNSLYSTKLLAANGADLNRVPYLGYPALSTACLNNNFDIAEYLIQKGADINLTDSYGTTPLTLMCIYQNFYMADMLLYYRANPNKPTNNGETPLILSIKNGDKAFVSLLINKEANVNKADNNGNSPLLIACQLNDTSIVKLLIDNDANVNQRNNNGYDALSFAIKNKNEWLVKYLVNKGANVSASYEKGLTPSTISAIYGNPRISKIIKQNGGEYDWKPTFNNHSFEIEMPFNKGEYLPGTNFSFIEKKYHLALETGFRMRPWRIRILDKFDDYKYYQFWERRFLLYTGIRQYRKLTNIGKNATLNIDYGINAAYVWGNYRGSGFKPNSKLMLIPNASIYHKYDFLETGIGYEYMEFDLLKKSPHTITIYVRFAFRNKFEQQFIYE